MKEEYRNMTKRELLDVIDDYRMQVDNQHKHMYNINTFQGGQQGSAINPSVERMDDMNLDINFLDTSPNHKTIIGNNNIHIIYKNEHATYSDGDILDLSILEL